MPTLPRDKFSEQLVVFVFALGVVLLTTLTVRNWAEELAKPAVIPISIADPDMTIVANNPDVCPGEILSWPLTITYIRGGILIDVVRNVRNIDTNALVAIDGHIIAEELRIPQEEAGTFERTGSWRVPNLPPARYRLITSARSTTGGSLLQYYVEFTVGSDCP